MVFAISVNAMRTNIKFEKHKENPLVAWLAVFPLNSDIQFQRWFKPPVTEFIKGWFTLKHQDTSTISSPKVNDPE